MFSFNLFLNRRCLDTIGHTILLITFYVLSFLYNFKVYANLVPVVKGAPVKTVVDETLFACAWPEIPTIMRENAARVVSILFSSHLLRERYV